MLQLNHLLLNQLSNEMMFDIDMLSFRMLHWILQDGNGTHVIAVQMHYILLNIILAQHLSATASSSNVLCLTCG